MKKVVVLQFESNKSKMSRFLSLLLVNYESPDGAKRHNRLWNGGNGIGTIKLFDRHGTLVDRIHAENIGCEYGEYDTGQRT